MQNLTTDVSACRGRGVLAKICSDSADADGSGGTLVFFTRRPYPASSRPCLVVGRCCIQGTQKDVCGSSPARSRLTSPTAQVHVRELGWTRGIEEEVRIESVRKATHILPSSVEPLGPTTHHIKNKSTLTIHIRKGPPVVLSMHLILRTTCTPQSQISLPL